MIDPKILNYSGRVTEVDRYFRNTKYDDIANKVYDAYMSYDYDTLEANLALLPTKEELLSTLLKSLEGKSVHTTLSKITDGKVNDPYVLIKGLMSLGTHVAIECENGNSEYRILLFDIYEKLGKLLYL